MNKLTRQLVHVSVSYITTTQLSKPVSWACETFTTKNVFKKWNYCAFKQTHKVVSGGEEGKGS